ncbi:unnamed protein product [Triticum aestivum]|uniref:Uncharacterized protein n=1 Tax=Triticum aestivum TaxID=4565 RepID=A0A7H4LMM2_WHEAT|nr:unnamed protein product [Triticum aestivum]
MADARPNSDGLAVAPPGKVKKKAAKVPRKPRSECTSEEIAKLDAKSTKRRNRRAVVKGNAAATKFAAERDAMEAARRKAAVDEKEDIVNKAHALLMLGMCRPAGFPAAAVGPTSTGSSVARPPHCQSPTSRTTPMSLGFPPPRHDDQTRFSGSPDVGVIAPSTPRPSAVVDLNVTLGSSSGGRPSVEMQRKQARPPFTGTMPSPRVLFDEMPTPTSPIDDPFYNQFMEDVIYEGGQGRTYDPDETQSQDGRAQYVADEEADNRADYDHGDSWHEDDDIYCEGDGDEEESNDIDIGGEPLFIDELTQRAEAQKRRKSIHTGSYTQEEDKLICQCWMEISQNPRTGVQQKGLVFWTRVHKTFLERKMFEPYQITSNRGITLIQKRKRGKKTAKFAGGGDGEALKRPRGKTNSKVDDIRDASSMALHETLHGMMSQKDVRDEKKWHSKDEQMKQYLELQRKKLEMEEAAKRRKIDMEEAARQRQLDIEAANVSARQR